MDIELFARVVSMNWTPALIFGLIAFVLHLGAYGWYSLEMFRGRTRPNSASWVMWLIGAWVEFVTYDAIESHWSTSALPFACLIGIGIIFTTSTILHIREWVRGTHTVIYEKPDRNDYYLVLADIGAYALYLLTASAAWANFIAVSTTIVTFIPIWKTTWRNGNEHPGPWIVWCTAYGMMLGAVVTEQGTEVVTQSFYPVYYFILCAVVVYLAWKRKPSLDTRI